MATALIAAISLALVLVAAVVIPMVLTPGVYGFSDWPKATPHGPREHVVSIAVPERRAVPATPVQRRSQPPAAPAVAPHRVLAQATPPKPAVAPPGQPQQPQKPEQQAQQPPPQQPQAAPEAPPAAPAVEARVELDGTNEP